MTPPDLRNAEIDPAPFSDIKNAFSRFTLSQAISAQGFYHLSDRLSTEEGFFFFGNLSLPEGVCWLTCYPRQTVNASTLREPSTNFGNDILVGLLDYGTERNSRPANRYTWFACLDKEQNTATLYFNSDCPQPTVEALASYCSRGEHSESSDAKRRHNRHFSLETPFTHSTGKQEYLDDIARIHNHLLSGTCYQINYAQRFAASCSGSPWVAFKALCRHTDAPYCIFSNSGARQVLCFSPEMFIEFDRRKVKTRPIKGTRPRGRTKAEDLALMEDLLTSEKDRAENLMIVDLLRNDLGRFCETGSVRADALFQLETYSNVHHLVSTVTGTLKKGVSQFSAFESAFPGGSITGAPKIKAMEIINELEKHQRGPYCGSFFYALPDGTFFSNIAIRTFYCEAGSIYGFGGGGIVADSDALSEYQESLDKIQVFLTTLEREFLSGIDPLR